MFYKYEVLNNGKEDILYLYLNMQYEFSKELTFKDNQELSRRTKNFIRTNDINFKGNKVYLIVDGIVVRVLDISKSTENYVSNFSFSADNYLVNIRLDDNSICEVSLREYLLGVLLSKYMNNIHIEALKAMCVLFNSYAYKMMRDNNYILSINDFVIYKPSSYYKTIMNDYDEVINILNTVINEVDCVFMSYNNDYILPFIHYSNSGKTLLNDKYPYLSSIKSLWDMASPYYLEIRDVSYDVLSKKLSTEISSVSNINIIGNKTNKKVKFDSNIFTIEELKQFFDLKSTDLYIIIYSNFLRFITIGWGNSYGLSLFGASEIAKTGAKYYNILKYYFPKVSLFKYAKELS